MKALLITHDFLPGLPGGIAEYYHRLAQNLAPALEVLAPAMEGDEVFDHGEAYRVHRRRIRTLGGGHLEGADAGLRRTVSLVALLLSHLRDFRRFGRGLLDGGEFRAVLLGHAYLSPLVHLLGRKRRGFRVGVVLHGSELHRFSGISPVEGTLISALNAADFLVVNSEFTRAQYLRRGVRPAQAVKVMNPGVELERFHPGAGDPDGIRRRLGIGDRPMILSVARLVEWKGQDVVIRALPWIFRHVPDAVYVIPGTGPYEAALKGLARETGVEDRVLFPGWMDEEDLPSLYRAADVMAVPSREFQPGRPVEGFGIVFMEASACGTPVIGGNLGGTEESILEGVTGFRVPPEDTGAVASGIVRLLADPALAQQMGEAGAARARTEFAWPRLAGSLLDFLEELPGP